MSHDPILDAKDREEILARIMARDGVSRSQALALLQQADIERLRMRDA